jgi:hypothetical protein
MKVANRGEFAKELKRRIEEALSYKQEDFQLRVRRTGPIGTHEQFEFVLTTLDGDEIAYLTKLTDWQDGEWLTLANFTGMLDVKFNV